MSDQTKSEATKQETKPSAQGLTKIPVTKVWLREQLDLPGGNVMERLDCLPQKAPGRSFYIAFFVPSHQVIELQWWKTEKTEPHLTRLPLSFVKKFE